MTQPLLKILNLTAHYDVAQALFDVNLTILPGQAVALMGCNGMGKTTNVNVVCGLLGCTSGEVHFNGHECGQMASYKIARLGIGLVPEGLAPVIRQEIWHTVARLKDAGQSILLIDKSLAELLPITDLCVLLERGSTLWQGAPEELNSDLRGRYLGI